MYTNRTSLGLEERIDILIELGSILQAGDEMLEAIFHRTSFHNPWFTIENQQKSKDAIVAEFLDEGNLRKWAGHYAALEQSGGKTVALILAGNIPFVGFHDMISVFLAGHTALIKTSEKDPYVTPRLIELLNNIDSRTCHYFAITERLKNFDAVIATGSNNSSRYFESYFGKYPHIIRRNRNSVAVLNGHERDAELLGLGSDIFEYFGLGCRNVSKLYIPENQPLDHLIEVLHEYRSIILNDKYKNNFDYNFALFSLNRIPFWYCGSILLKNDTSLQSRIASLNFEYYDNIENLTEELQRRKSEIQCVVAKPELLSGVKITSFGKTQSPGLFDYADEVDTIQFLVNL